MLVGDVLLYAVLTWYCDKVLPNPCGQRYPPWFIFQPFYWKSAIKRTFQRIRFKAVAKDGAMLQHLLQDQTSSHFHEDESAAVMTSNLVKVYRTVDGHSKRAVDNASMEFHTGRITALLGHNGAGKTTTMHILTGMIQPTSGTAYINGRSILTDMHQIRLSLGICPQFDILWPDMTAKEHLSLYAAIKGFKNKDIPYVIQQSADEVGLTNKLETLAGELSGGQRRKLSVAIAFLGDPGVVFLDEPTSGMDPYSKRFTWEIIRKHKAATAIILTTHSMEEADLLCDHIIIMAEGRIAAEGNSMTLKEQYGVGYTLTLVLAPHLSKRHSCRGAEDQEKIVHAIRNYIPSAEVTAVAGLEMAFQLPRDCSPQFPELLRHLEDQKRELGIDSYGLSVTTLEEVFLNITRNVNVQDSASAAEARDGKENGHLSMLELQRSHSNCCASETPDPAQIDETTDANALSKQKLLKGCALYLHQLKALFIKRALCARRDRMAVVTQLIVPLFLVYLAIWITSLSVRSPATHALTMSRGNCLKHAAVLLAAEDDIRADPIRLNTFLDAYARVDVKDTGQSSLYNGQNLNKSLEGYLLDSWYDGNPHYDGLFIENLSSLADISAGKLFFRYTILVNQSAIAALPASLSQANSAVMQILTKSLVAASSIPFPRVRMRKCHHSSSQSPCSSTIHHRYSSVKSSMGITHAVRRLAAGQEKNRYEQSDNLLDEQREKDRTGIDQRFVLVDQPLPELDDEKFVQVKRNAGNLMLVLCLVMASSVLSASFVVFLVREQENNSKHVQIVSGASPTAFWIANYAWDMINFSIPATGIMLLFLAYQLPQFMGPRFAAVVFLLWMFGLAGLSLTYFLHFFFKEEKMVTQDEMKALQRLNTLYFVVGYLGFLLTWILDLITTFLHRENVESTNKWAKKVLWTFSPHFCFAKGVYDVQATYSSGSGGAIPFGPKPSRSPYDMNVLGIPMIHMLIQAVLYGGLVLLLELGLLQKIIHYLREVKLCNRFAVVVRREDDTNMPGDHEDADVKRERQIVKRMDPRLAQMTLVGLKKSYSQGFRKPPVTAVAELWLEVQKGECFGLLGVNGAGKTTTFKMLTGEILPEEGSAFISGHNVVKDASKARQKTGYCPQFEALPLGMTGREVLHMYARLRGVPESCISSTSATLLDQLGLSNYANMECSTYSGGNKRKLNVALALVGDPPVLLLDEPSTGMDPGAKRFLWSVLQKQGVDAGNTIVLTSHSMEECEALCTKIGIMVAGRLACLGSVQHLKDKFGSGYNLDLRVNMQNETQALNLSEQFALEDPVTSYRARTMSRPTTSQVCDFFLKQFPEMKMVEEDAGRIRMAVPKENVNLPALFLAAERAMQDLGVIDYSLSQTSLEQVFVNLARSQDTRMTTTGG